MFGRTRLVAGAMSVLLVAVSAGAALAAAPDNDDIAAPTVVAAIPYTNSQDTTEATTGPTDPDCAGTGPTVWYQYTPSDSARLEVNTFGSDYDTTLYVGTPDGAGGIDLLACNDDAGGGVQSRIRFDAEAGVTYLFMVGSFASGPGGATTINLDVAPPVVPVTLAITLDRSGTFDRNGMATIGGSLSCAGADFVELNGFLSQAVGRFRIAGGGWDVVPCTGATTWQLQIWSSDGKFAGGSALAYVEAFACGEEECAFDNQQGTVRLRK